MNEINKQQAWEPRNSIKTTRITQFQSQNIFLDSDNFAGKNINEIRLIEAHWLLDLQKKPKNKAKRTNDEWQWSWNVYLCRYVWKAAKKKSFIQCVYIRCISFSLALRKMIDSLS